MKGPRPTARTLLLYGVGCGLLFAGGLGLAHRYDVELAVRPSAGNAAASESDYVPRYRREGGDQLLLLYVGSAGCGWSNAPGLASAVRTLKRRLADHAEAEGMTFKAVGVALDWNPKAGVRHLGKFGPFDELSAGYNWGNSLAVEYWWEGEAGTPATPQVVLYRRSFTVPETGGELVYREQARALLGVASGFHEIVRWAESDEALPVAWRTRESARG